MKNPATTHETFRLAITPMAVGIAVIGLGYFTIELLIEKGRDINLVAYIVGMTGGFLTSWVGASILSFVFTEKLGPDGLYGHSVWGNRRFIEWSDIGEVRIFRFLTWKYARIFSRNTGRVTWLALFPANPEAFRAAMRKYCPPGNDLLKLFGDA